MGWNYLKLSFLKDLEQIIFREITTSFLNIRYEIVYARENMQCNIRTVSVIETYVHDFPLNTTIYLDGAGSPEVGRLILEGGRVRLQEKRGDRYKTITSTKPGKPANYLLNAPSNEFVGVLESNLYQKELDQALADAVKEYGKSPVITAQSGIDWVPRSDGEQEQSWYNAYSRRLKNIARLRAARGNEEPQLHELPELLESVTVIFNNPRRKYPLPYGPYESQNGVASAHSTNDTTYVIDNSPTAEQLAKRLSEMTGWRLGTRHNHH